MRQFIHCQQLSREKSDIERYQYRASKGGYSIKQGVWFVRPFEFEKNSFSLKNISLSIIPTACWSTYLVSKMMRKWDKVYERLEDTAFKIKFDKFFRTLFVLSDFYEFPARNLNYIIWYVRVILFLPRYAPHRGTSLTIMGRMLPRSFEILPSTQNIMPH